jgi:hypothetical protein
VSVHSYLNNGHSNVVFILHNGRTHYAQLQNGIPATTRGQPDQDHESTFLNYCDNSGKEVSTNLNEDLQAFPRNYYRLPILYIPPWKSSHTPPGTHTHTHPFLLFPTDFPSHTSPDSGRELADSTICWPSGKQVPNRRFAQALIVTVPRPLDRLLPPAGLRRRLWPFDGLRLAELLRHVVDVELSKRVIPPRSRNIG